MRELIVDNFAGGGGASTGIEMALGRSPDYAINHDGAALAMHEANHPDTEHVSKNIWQVDPLDVVGQRPVGLAWFSPDCKHFSRAKGGKPVARNIRDLAWTVVLWARRVRPRVIILENVSEFRDWGPLVDRGDGKWLPCPNRRGQTFERWAGELRRLGYRVQWRELRACDYGAPTIRKRLFLIARRDGLPIVWPEPTHGKPGTPGLQPWRTAAEIIDWSLPCPSIFLTAEEGRAIGVNRPLAEATMARIAKGVRRYVIEADEPFVAPGCGGTLIQTGYGEREGQSPRVPGLDKPLGTVVAGGVKHALVAAFLAQHNAGPRAPFGRGADEPLSTVTATGSQQAVVSAGLLHLKGSERGMTPVDAPTRTVLAGGGHQAEVRAFLIKYYGDGGQDQDCREPLHTVPTRDRFGVVMVHGEPYQIVDIGMRMLTPRELFRAQGFPDSYIIDPEHNGRPLTKSEQVRMCGNSVSPPVAAALVRANYAEEQATVRKSRTVRAEADLFGAAA